jgi:hypothetical protein
MTAAGDVISSGRAAAAGAGGTQEQSAKLGFAGGKGGGRGGDGRRATGDGRRCWGAAARPVGAGLDGVEAEGVSRVSELRTLYAAMSP